MTADSSYGGSDRAATTRLRHGQEFYARIGRRSQELRRRARAGDAAALDLLARRRSARAGRRQVWAEVLEAREAVHLLHEELHSSIRANSEACRALMLDRYQYTRRLRGELAAAEAKLATLEARHQELLQDLRAALPSGEADAAALADQAETDAAGWAMGE